MTDMPPVLTDRHALFLDFDGTLVGFAKIPSEVEVDPKLSTTLDGIRSLLGGALAIVTGREIVNINKQLTPLVLPVAGSHGAERRRMDGVIETPAPEVGEAARAIAERLTAELGDIENLIIERKVFSVAVHYRNVPEQAERIVRTGNAILADLPDWEGVHGKMVIEIRPASISKGSAVTAFMTEEPFVGRIPVFVGDDTTDEDGMKAATEFGGFGIKVGAGDSVAQYRLEDHLAVHRYLESAL